MTCLSAYLLLVVLFTLVTSIQQFHLKYPKPISNEIESNSVIINLLLDYISRSNSRLKEEKLKKQNDKILVNYVL